MGVVDLFELSNGATLDRISYHALRVTFNTAMQRAGVPLETREAIIGHAPQGGVNVEEYTKFDLTGLTEAVQKVTHGTVDQIITNGDTT